MDSMTPLLGSTLVERQQDSESITTNPNKTLTGKDITFIR